MGVCEKVFIPVRWCQVGLSCIVKIHFFFFYFFVRSSFGRQFVMRVNDCLRLDVIMTVSLWNLTGMWGACQISERLEKSKLESHSFWGFAKSCGKMSVPLVNKGPGLLMWCILYLWHSSDEKWGSIGHQRRHWWQQAPPGFILRLGVVMSNVVKTAGGKKENIRNVKNWAIMDISIHCHASQNASS